MLPQLQAAAAGTKLGGANELVLPVRRLLPEDLGSRVLGAAAQKGLPGEVHPSGLEGQEEDGMGAGVGGAASVQPRQKWG